MKWHKIEDYPVGSDEYVLVSTNRTDTSCFVAKLVNRPWNDKLWDTGYGVRFSTSPIDRWCHIDLPED